MCGRAVRGGRAPGAKGAAAAATTSASWSNRGSRSIVAHSIVGRRRGPGATPVTRQRERRYRRHRRPEGTLERDRVGFVHAAEEVHGDVKVLVGHDAAVAGPPLGLRRQAAAQGVGQLYGAEEP